MVAVGAANVSDAAIAIVVVAFFIVHAVISASTDTVPLSVGFRKEERVVSWIVYT